MSMIGIRGVECGLCGGSSVVEHLPSKQRAAGSNPVSRSTPPHKINRETRKIAPNAKRGGVWRGGG